MQQLRTHAPSCSKTTIKPSTNIRLRSGLVDFAQLLRKLGNRRKMLLLLGTCRREFRLGQLQRRQCLAQKRLQRGRRSSRAVVVVVAQLGVAGGCAVAAAAFVDDDDGDADFVSAFAGSFSLSSEA